MSNQPQTPNNTLCHAVKPKKRSTEPDTERFSGEWKLSDNVIAANIKWAEEESASKGKESDPKATEPATSSPEPPAASTRIHEQALENGNRQHASDSESSNDSKRTLRNQPSTSSPPRQERHPPRRRSSTPHRPRTSNTNTDLFMFLLYGARQPNRHLLLEQMVDRLHDHMQSFEGINVVRDAGERGRELMQEMMEVALSRARATESDRSQDRERLDEFAEVFRRGMEDSRRSGREPRPFRTRAGFRFFDDVEPLDSDHESVDLSALEEVLERRRRRYRRRYADELEDLLNSSFGYWP